VPSPTKKTLRLVGIVRVAYFKFHQQIGVNLLAIIGFTPYYWQLLVIIAIIGYYFFAKSFHIIGYYSDKLKH
jgi:hypothetical protein